MVAEDNVKEKISIIDYGNLLTDCSFTAIGAGIPPFLIGLVGIPLALKKLNKFVTVNNEIKVGLCIFGSVALGLYSMKAVRLSCEQKVVAKYEV